MSYPENEAICDSQTEFKPTIEPITCQIPHLTINPKSHRWPPPSSVFSRETDEIAGSMGSEKEAAGVGPGRVLSWKQQGQQTQKTRLLYQLVCSQGLGHTCLPRLQVSVCVFAKGIFCVSCWKILPQMELCFSPVIYLQQYSSFLKLRSPSPNWRDTVRKGSREILRLSPRKPHVWPMQHTFTVLFMDELPDQGFQKRGSKTQDVSLSVP